MTFGGAASIRDDHGHHSLRIFILVIGRTRINYDDSKRQPIKRTKNNKDKLTMTVISDGNPNSSLTAVDSSSSTTSKRRRTLRREVYHVSAAEHIENRCLVQALQNSKVDTIRSSIRDIPYAPVFYPTVEEFELNPIQYIEQKVRPIAEQYGICKIVPPAGWNPRPYCSLPLSDEEAVTKDMEASSADVPNNETTFTPPEKDFSYPTNKSFETKYQLLHRLQEGIAFQDGQRYTPAQYVQMASKTTKEYQNLYYPQHDLLMRNSIQTPNADTSIEEASNENASADPLGDKTAFVVPEHVQKHLFTTANLEQDYWDIVECCSEKKEPMVVEYGNDVDTTIYGSGFPLSRNGRSLATTSNNSKKKKKSHSASNASPTSGTKNAPVTSPPSQQHQSSIKVENETDESETNEPAFTQTEDYYRETWWNLNNIPNAPDSILRYVKVGINGINVPWMYYGSLFTTFCWHNEDNYLCSINYHHIGAPKQWYGVPGTPKEAPDGLEKVFKSYLSLKMRDVPDLLHHITTMFNPRLLQKNQVPVYKTIQHPGEFVITFPRAYHCGFSYGPNIGEAVNFASYPWISYGADANERYRFYQRPAVFSHERLAWIVAHHVEQDMTCPAECAVLYQEIKRIVRNELQLREQALNVRKIRDVSQYISLRKNECEAIDELCMNYDEQRLCYLCKQICFFTAVGCQCSQSKVSCLQHAHCMCTCANSRTAATTTSSQQYLMIWTSNEELEALVQRVGKHWEFLQQTEAREAGAAPSDGKADSPPITTKHAKLAPAVPAPGVAQDLQRHAHDTVFTNRITLALFHQGAEQKMDTIGVNVG
jgi:JmjC domain, hydroxylase/jmjN domain/C5HC2 zinc finger